MATNTSRCASYRCLSGKFYFPCHTFMPSARHIVVYSDPAMISILSLNAKANSSQAESEAKRDRMLELQKVVDDHERTSTSNLCS